ncbi:MAG: hypothetical protein LBT74_01495 [Acidobacteriota bacterium]|jgi:hypothetical protein|nr:hypothetical protein [Acidobacteriota bacterium]
MKIRMYSNDVEAPLTPFIGRYVGNVCVGIVDALKTNAPVRTLRYDLEGDAARIRLNGEPLPLDLASGFAEKMISDTVRGMIRRLKMDDPAGVVRIEIEL